MCRIYPVRSALLRRKDNAKSTQNMKPSYPYSQFGDDETPKRGPETARCPVAKTGERCESYERTGTDRFGRQYLIRVTIRTVPMTRKIKRTLQRLSE
jgi:hypothetical protein